MVGKMTVIQHHMGGIRAEGEREVYASIGERSPSCKDARQITNKELLLSREFSEITGETKSSMAGDVLERTGGS